MNPRLQRSYWQAGGAWAMLCGLAAPALAEQLIDVHAQYTFTAQAHPRFPATEQGANSLYSGSDAALTNDVTLYIGASLWQGAEIWVNPEIDQGFGLSNTLGIAGFPSSEAYKVGKTVPYYRTQRLFFRQTLNLGGAHETVDADANQRKLTRTADRLVLTLGKFSVGDVFDNNGLAHDPRKDYFNWAAIDTGTFDYAADSWGYSAGGVAELYTGNWTVRGALMALSNAPNGEALDLSFAQHQWIGEVERRFNLGKQAGVVRVTGFESYARMGRFDDALKMAAATGDAPSTALVRHYAHRAGIGASAELALSGTLGVFARAGVADGSHESFDFTDIDRTITAGVTLQGAAWHRAGDVTRLALIVNDISKARQSYLAAGGMGVLIGDGALMHKGKETILETQYSLGLGKGVQVSLDGQMVFNPGYNRDHGPVPVLGVRLHYAR